MLHGIICTLVAISIIGLIIGLMLYGALRLIAWDIQNQIYKDVANDPKGETYWKNRK